MAKKKYLQIKFGVPFFDLSDGQYSILTVPVAVRGYINIQIKNHRNFLKKQGLTCDSFTDFENKLRTVIIQAVKEFLFNVVEEYKLSIYQLESKSGEISDFVSRSLTKKLKQEFNIKSSYVSITAIEIDKQSDGYKQLKSVTQDIVIAKIQEQAHADILNIADGKNKSKTAKLLALFAIPTILFLILLGFILF